MLLFPYLHKPFSKNIIGAKKANVIGPIILGMVAGNLLLWIPLLRGDNLFRGGIESTLSITIIVGGIAWAASNYFFEYAPIIKYNLRFEELITELQMYVATKYEIDITRTQAARLLTDERVPYMYKDTIGEIYLVRSPQGETNARIMFNKLADELPVVNVVS